MPRRPRARACGYSRYPTGPKPSGRNSTVKRIVTFGRDLDQAFAGQSVTLTPADEVDCSRGDVISIADNPPEVSDQFEATLVWMDEHEMVPGRAYWLKIGTQIVPATNHQPKYRINVNAMEHLAAKTLDLNAIGAVTLATDRKITFEPYADHRQAGREEAVTHESPPLPARRRQCATRTQ